MSTIFEQSKKGKNKFNVPEIIENHYDDIPQEFANESLDLPDVNETEVVRHFTNLSKLNFGVDNGMYPLGSCTMKYNPKINEKLSKLENFANNHPLCDENISQGSLRSHLQPREIPFCHHGNGQIFPPAGGRRSRRTDRGHDNEKIL